MKLQNAQLTRKPRALRAREGGQPQLALAGRLARIKGESILFSPANRAIYALNETAADIWEALGEGLSPGAVARMIAGHGIEPREAAGLVDKALGEWERLGLLHPASPPAGAAPGSDVTMTVRLPGIRARITCLSGSGQAALGIFRHLEVPGGHADVEFQVAAQRDGVRLFRDGRWRLSCAADELPTLLKGELLSEVLERTGYELALHAAALARGGRLLLLCGSPGAGKTTLTMALVCAGFGFAGDDVTLLDSRGCGQGIPFAPAVKAGAWPFLADYLPDLSAAPVFRRPDRKRVRYPVPARVAPAGALPVGWVVLLRRGSTARAALTPVELPDALEGLLSGSFSRSRQLSGSAFQALADVIASAEVYSLGYSRLSDAVGLLAEACG